MKIEFISFNIFNKIWDDLGLTDDDLGLTDDDLGLTDDDLRELEEYLITNPESGSVIQGTGGVRKLRWAIKNKGKSGGIRILYIDFIYYEKIYLLMAYQKNKKENINNNDKKIIKQLVSDLKTELRRKNNEK